MYKDDAKEQGMLSERRMLVALSAAQNSGMTGMAELREENGQTKVSLTMQGIESSVARPAHIHAGSCAALGAVEFPLADVVTMGSETNIPVDFQRLADKLPLAINVHKSFAELSVNVACGEISEEDLRSMANVREGGIMMENEDGEKMMQESDMMETGSMMQDDGGMASAAGQYVAYTPETYEANKENKRVFFFHATWCPFCKQADADFNANLDRIPAGVVLLKTDYDTQAQLKQKYGITYQHTFVLVDAEGNAVATWNGGGVDELITRVR